MTQRPWLWILAGPNGSGKSTLARSGALRHLAEHAPARAQSPDDIARMLPEVVPPASQEAYIRAAQVASDTLVDFAIREARSIMVETVGSSGKFFGRIAAARDAGFGFAFIYVTLAQVALNQARVAQRKAQGGHDVPPDAVARRREGSYANFPRFAALADLGLLLDNSTTQPRLLAEKPEGAPWRVLDPEVAPMLTGTLAA